jgi:hypothetical protein
MPFFSPVRRHVSAGGHRHVPEPDFSIAKGLAYPAGWTTICARSGSDPR